MKDISTIRVLGFQQGKRLLVFSIDRIVRIEGWSNYSRIHFTDHPPILMARVLRSYEILLQRQGFVRTHKSHLVNLQHVLEVQTGGLLLMTDRSLATVSRRKRSEVRHILLHDHFAA
jgi:two-component system LytT family response regulator